jgi:hypothetical protein
VPATRSTGGSAQMRPQFAYHCPLSGCDPGSNDGNLGDGGSITNPGPLPNEGGCNPSIETDCGSSKLVAIQPGTPQQHKGQPCFGSPGTVDDSFYNQDKQNVEILDINTIWQDGQESGWLYYGSDGKTYIQYNYSDQAVWSWAVSIGIASGGASTPGGYSKIMPYKGGGGLSNVAGVVQAGSQVEKCYVQGQYLGGNFA